jgi:hypothetical protein
VTVALATADDDAVVELVSERRAHARGRSGGGAVGATRGNGCGRRGRSRLR